MHILFDEENILFRITFDIKFINYLINDNYSLS